MKMIDLGFTVNMINCRKPQILRQRGCKTLGKNMLLSIIMCNGLTLKTMMVISLFINCNS